VYLKIFGQNQIQKIEVLRPRQFAEVENSVKTLKNHSVFLKTARFPFPSPIFRPDISIQGNPQARLQHPKCYHHLPQQ
jgi:hypothetical protein